MILRVISGALILVSFILSVHSLSMNSNGSAAGYLLPTLVAAVLVAGYTVVAELARQEAQTQTSKGRSLWTGKFLALAMVSALAFGIIVLTNAHGFYLWSEMPKIRRQELMGAELKIKTLSQTSESVIPTVIDQTYSKLQQHTRNLTAQILNQGEPGLGRKSQIILDSIGFLLNAPITRLTSSGNTGGHLGLAKDMDRLIEEVWQQEKNKLLAIQAKVQEAIASMPEELATLENAIDTFDKIKPNQLKNIIQDAHNYHNTVCRTLNSLYQSDSRLLAFLQQDSTQRIVDLTPLPEPPASFELENVLGKAINPAHYPISFLFALCIDLVSIAIVLAGVWEKKSNIKYF